MGLEEMFAALADADREDEETTRPLPEAQISTLREACAAYTAGNPYKVGDLVTPRKWGNSKGAGDPHIVVEIGNGEACFSAQTGHDSGSAHYGRKRDIRVICFGTSDTIVAYWMEAYQVEPYVLSEN